MGFETTPLVGVSQFCSGTRLSKSRDLASHDFAPPYS